jgi:hypothetical protein
MFAAVDAHRLAASDLVVHAARGSRGLA